MPTIQLGDLAVDREHLEILAERIQGEWKTGESVS